MSPTPEASPDRRHRSAHTFSSPAARNRKRLLTTLTVAGMLAAGAGVAHADNISNSLDTTIDAQAENMPLNVGGPNGSTTLYVNPTNGDAKNGCNLTGATSLSLNLASSLPGVATVSPTSVTFTSCNDTKAVTVHPVSVGSTQVTAAITANTTGGTFNIAPVTFTVTVAPPTNTAPEIAVMGVGGGQSYSKGQVPAATCSVTDTEDGNSTFAAALSAVSGPYAADGIGSQTATCSYTDKGGLFASSSADYSIIDPSAPVITHTLTPTAPDGLNGWFTTNPTLTWGVAEPQSPLSLTKAGCEDQAITADQKATTYSCSASSAGGSAAQQDVTIAVDTTAPSVVASGATGTAGANGWYTSAVTATFTAEDATSGPASASRSVTSTDEGPVVSLSSPAFADNAGNTTAPGAVTADFKIDLSDPTASFDGQIGSVYFGQVPAAPTCTAADSVSGPAGCTVTGYSTALGAHVLTATALDRAGRSATSTQSYTVLPWTAKGFYQPVDMAGVMNTVKAGSTVPVKFELFAGSTELTDTGYVNLSAKIATCSTSAPVDEIEMISSGSTMLRYDTIGGQYIYNWKTPNTPGSCYKLTMTANDGSAVSANFKLK